MTFCDNGVLWLGSIDLGKQSCVTKQSVVVVSVFSCPNPKKTGAPNKAKATCMMFCNGLETHLITVELIALGDTWRMHSTGSNPLPATIKRRQGRQTLLSRGTKISEGWCNDGKNPEVSHLDVFLFGLTSEQHQCLNCVGT